MILKVTDNQHGRLS